MKYLVIGILILSLGISGCIPYVAGVIATSRANASGKQSCAETGGEWIDGSSWGWSTGRCMAPMKQGEERSPEVTCLELGGTWDAANSYCYPPQPQGKN